MAKTNKIPDAVIFDSSVWIAYMKKADTQHAKAIQIFEETDGQKIMVPEYVALEVSSVLAVRVTRILANNFLEIISDNSDIDILYSDRTFFTKTATLFRTSPTNRLSFTDTALLNLSRQYEVITFDTDLARAIKNI